MEIIINNNKTQIKLESNKIIGINKNIDLSKVLNTNNIIKINNLEINKLEYKKKISYINKDYQPISFKSNIYELMYYEIRKKDLKLKNPAKKMKDALRIVGLKVSLLERNINTLSSSERKLFSISLALLSNPEIIILEEPFIYLDLHNRKKLMILLKRMKDDYNKTIIIISNDNNILYKYTDYVLLYKNTKIQLQGNTKEVFSNITSLNKHKIELPESVEFTYKAKLKKNVRLDYHKDIRDLIKDIYKHV